MSLDVFLKLGILFQIVSETYCILDVTCFGNDTRVNDDDDMFIGGYRSGDDTDATISFGRTSYTKTGNGLPFGSEDRIGNTAVLHRMPASEGLNRIGAFYCEARKNLKTELITIIIMSQNSRVTPHDISQTVSISESVTFTMTTPWTQLRWWHNSVKCNGERTCPDWSNKKSVTIPSVTVDDAGVYECAELNNRNGKHAIFQLVVRACTAGRWGNSCEFDCPRCYNGGVCDERSAHGRNHWGQDWQLICSSVNQDACRGRMFCLPHPYGCSCGSGYRGIDCNLNCQEGFYGASCRSVCHCADDVTCDPYTREYVDGIGVIQTGMG
ncbi:angiopoietin-1 receptor-like [Amphiura filiformis]|uniref:angiopoietin-1 receptor-like n=1 Tax=Amphiura filiformis TaxID=82378 RepID=UPI003B2129B4